MPISAGRAVTTGSAWEASATWSPEATHSRDNSEKIMQFNYTSTVTNKLLLEAAFSQFFSNWGGQTPSGALDQAPFIPVTSQSIGTVDQATGVQIGVPVTTMVYHGFAGLSNNHQTHNVWRAPRLYVTGAHSMKVGLPGRVRSDRHLRQLRVAWAAVPVRLQRGAERGWCRT